MTGYTILRTENVPKILKNKPRWVVWIVCVVSLAVLTLSAVAAGILIGYTYCYVENKTGFQKVNATQMNGVQSHQAPIKDSLQGNDKKTINEAIYTLVQKILRVGHRLWDEEQYSLPWTYKARKFEGKTNS